MKWSLPMVNGGMGNVVAAHPTVGGRFGLGGDLWGWYESQDAAGSWQGTMHGLSGIGAIYARGIKYSLADPDAFYVAVGVLKSTGGYFGVAKGFTMTRRTGPNYGANLGSGAGGSLPRPVGSLIDVTLAGGIERIITSAYGGLEYSTDKGLTWHQLYSHIGNWKAIVAIDELTCLASLYNTTGLTLVHGSTVSHPTAPGAIHDMHMIAGTVWAVGAQGAFTWDGTKLNKHAAASAALGSNVATTIAGSADGQVLVIGTVGVPVFVSHDGGKTWNNVGTSAHSPMTTFDGRPYWLAHSGTNGWSQPRFSSSHAAVDQTDPNNMVIAGRGGAWGTHDAGNTWHPCAPCGSEVTASRGGPGQDEFAWNDNDWIGAHTPDAFHTIDHVKTAQTGLHSGLTASAGGHSYRITGQDIMKDGVSIADDVFRGSCVDAKTIAVSPSGKVLVGQYGGTLLLGTP